MAVYVAEIGGKAVLAFGAEDEFAAKRFVEGEWLGSDLRVPAYHRHSAGY